MRRFDGPAIGLGTWYLGDDPRQADEEVAALRRGLDLGLRVIDTAEMYGSGRSERLVGRAIAGRRDEVTLVTKVLPHHADRAGVAAAARESLTRLGTTHVDVYLLHWRGPVPLAETVEALELLVEQGLTRAWGVSNFDAADLAELASVTDQSRCATNQVLYNLTRRGPEWDLLPLMREAGMPLMAYSPIEQGRLLHGRAAAPLARLAADCGLFPAVLALAWAVRDGTTLAIPKSGDVEHVEENARAAEVTLPADVLAELDAVFPPPAGPAPLEML